MSDSGRSGVPTHIATINWKASIAAVAPMRTQAVRTQLRLRVPVGPRFSLDRLRHEVLRFGLVLKLHLPKEKGPSREAKSLNFLAPEVGLEPTTP